MANNKAGGQQEDKPGAAEQKESAAGSTKRSKLEASDQDAKQQNAQQLSGDSPHGCKQERQILEAQVVGEDDKPLGAIAVELLNSEDKVLRGKTDGKGDIRFTDLEKGTYKLSLYELDEEAWEVEKNVALPTVNVKSAAEAPWQPSADKDQSKPFDHIAEQGECMSKLADRFGFFPDTLWDHPDNAKLKAERRERSILNPGDKVVIPARSYKSVEVETAKRYHIRRKGVPETLRIEFLESDESPRAEVPYLIRIKTEDEQVIADRKGKTNNQGFLVESVPPAAKLAEIVLGKGDEQETYEFLIGHMDPVDTISGMQARLNNMGYFSAEEDGELNEATESAIRTFQADEGLEVTGRPNKATQDAMKKAYGC